MNIAEKINVLMMGFYGNRTIVDITREKLENKTEGINLEHYILGILDVKAIDGSEKFDTTIISIPRTNLVIIYNKYQEERERNRQGKLKPLVNILEHNIKIHSRCAICRRNEEGKLYSIESKDIDSIIKYLAE